LLINSTTSGNHEKPVLFGYGETVRTLPHPSYTEDQVIGDWFPGEDPLPASGEREGPASAGG
jgi:hypothetical protein